MGRTLGLMALYLALASPVAAQRIHLQSGAPPLERPVLDSAAVVNCVWPATNTRAWEQTTVAGGAMALRVPPARLSEARDAIGADLREALELAAANVR